MADEIGFENGRNSNFQGLVTLTLDPAIRHTVVHQSSTYTYIPNFIQIEETFCGRTGIFPPLILLGRLLEVDLKIEGRWGSDGYCAKFGHSTPNPPPSVIMVICQKILTHHAPPFKISEIDTNQADTYSYDFQFLVPYCSIVTMAYVVTYSRLRAIFAQFYHPFYLATPLRVPLKFCNGAEDEKN